MIEHQPQATHSGLVPMKRIFIVESQMRLNETSSPMNPGQEGFAYLPVVDPVELEIDAIPYTVSRSVFVASTRWKSA